MIQHLLILQVLLPLIAAPLCLAFCRSKVAGIELSWLFATVVLCLSFLVTIALLLQLDTTIIYVIGNWQAPWGIEYKLDKLNAYLLLIINAIAVFVVMASKDSIAREVKPERINLFYTLFLLNITGFNGVLITNDMFNVYVFIEIASLSSYALISMGKNPRALYAAYQYLIMGTIGASFILIGVGLLYAMTGTLSMADISVRLPAVEHTNTVTIAFIFFMLGVLLKCAFFPLHLWMLDAYHYAPSAISAFLAGTSSKVFIYLLIRFIFSVFGVDFVFMEQVASKFLLLFACVAMVYGSWMAIYQDSLKRMLAYSSVAQIGYIILGLSLMTGQGLVASLLHMFNHALIKVGLFLSVALIIYRYSTDLISQLHGVARDMWLVYIMFLISGVSLIGVPLTAGFISKWYLLQAAMAQGYWLVVVFMLLSSFLAVIYIGKVLEALYFQPKTANTLTANTDRSVLLITVTALFALASIFFGIQTDLSVGFAKEIVAQLYQS